MIRTEYFVHALYGLYNGLVDEIKDPEGSIWKREYDENRNVSKEINPLGHITQYKYNNDNQLV
ncbi:hypothetical protein, partial [Acinetobacter baumannii]|uniref:hypothetical protein n=1 Tax=Acinetobacter baumannii TaxID=470 RepID=UPI0038CD7F19